MDDQASESVKDNSSKIYIEKLKNLINAAQVEPIIFLFSFNNGLEDVFITNLIIDKVCDVQFDYGEEVCSNLDSGQYEDQQNEVQKQTSIYGMDRHFTEYIPGVVTVFLLAALGESKGLKYPIFVTIFGQLMKVLLILFNALYWSLSPMWIVMCFLPYAICGGYSGFNMSVFTYIGLTSDTKSRTTRLAFATVMDNIGMSVGIITAPAIYNQFGYSGVFLTSSLIYILMLIYILFRLRNCKAESESSEIIQSKNMIGRLKSTLTTSFKKRENRGRAKVIGHISTIIIYVFIMGVPNFYYLYARKKFAWDYDSYSIWDALTYPTAIIGTVVVMPSLSYIWNIDDSVIGLIGYISKMWQYMLMATAPVGWVMYLATLTSVCGGLVTPSSRSALSKLVPQTEITSVFAVVSALEALTPVLDNPLYTYIYNTTLEVFPGTVFVVASCCSVIGCAIYMWLYYPFKEESKEQTKLSVEEKQKTEDWDDLKEVN